MGNSLSATGYGDPSSCLSSILNRPMCFLHVPYLFDATRVLFLGKPKASMFRF